MSQSYEIRARIQTLDERLTRLRAEKQRLVARASQTERKRDTRRKILIGGVVLAAIDHEGVPALKSRADLLRWMDTRLTRPHDRAVFEFAPQEPASPGRTSRISDSAATAGRRVTSAPPAGVRSELGS